jgi:predicted MFS family arabinose efflux permease
MTDDATTSGSTPIIFDGWRSISVSLYMALIGYSVMVTLPVLSTALVAMLGFTEVQVGRVWGADLGGLSLGAIISSMLVSRLNRRHLVVAGVVLSVTANALCIFSAEYEQVLWLRVAAGMGSGVFTSVAVVTLGGTTKPVRAFNMLLFAFAFSAALQLHILPQLSMNEIYLVFIGTTTGCALFLPWLPTRALNAEELTQQEQSEEDVEDWHVPRILPVICLIAICFTYINIGGYFTYIELAALADGIAKEWIGPLLTGSSMFALVGCGLALLCQRFGMFKPLFVSLFAMAAIVIMLSGGITDISVMVSLFSFTTLWTFVDVYQSAMMAHMDRSGSLIALMPGVQGFGNFIGPNISASVLGAGMGYSVMFVISSSMALVAMFLYIGVFVYMHRRKPAPARAI